MNSDSLKMIAEGDADINLHKKDLFPIMTNKKYCQALKERLKLHKEQHEEKPLKLRKEEQRLQKLHVEKLHEEQK